MARAASGMWNNFPRMAKSELLPHLVPAAPQQDTYRPLSALLAQALVAFTVEFDNEFELRMRHADYPGARISLVVWSNLVRFIPADGISVRSLAAQALAEPPALKHQLGCLERWGFVLLHPESSIGEFTRATPRLPFHPGWGSTRRIGADWLASLTPKGQKAKEIWPPLFLLTEQRWHKRFGTDEITRLRDALQAILDELPMQLPQGFVDLRERKAQFPAQEAPTSDYLPLPVLLAQLLMAFALEFEPQSAAPLALCANSLRVLSDQPIPEREIAALTGSSPETAGIGWQLKRYVAVAPDATTGRGKVVRLTERGLLAQREYRRLTDAIEAGWEDKFGSALRQSLLSLFDREGRGSHPLLMSEGLVPPAGTVRAGDASPALGRRDIGSAAQKRARDLVAQTRSFIANPAAALPHYPLWDMNRGFGP